MDCTKVKMSEKDFQELSFTSIPSPVKSAIIELVVQNKMDTAFSLEKSISYSFNNSGDGKGYTEQVLRSKNMHIINGKCYEFLLYSKPYIIYNNVIYFLEQNLPLNCSGNPCYPDTTGINETFVYSLPLSKVLL